MIKIIEILNSIDTTITLFLNSLHSVFFDFVMYWLSDRFIWIPLYLFLLYIIIKTEKKKTYLILFCILILIIISDQTSCFIKDTVKRLRPCHENSFGIHIVKNYCGGEYGFISSHASNIFAISIFAIKLLKQNFKWITPSIIIWACIVSYSRIYLGVHYFGDVVCGAIFGSCLALIFFKIYIISIKKIFLKQVYE
ncbi:MAG: phosphatase PAP2 family protein [Bacteroidales bacterium]|nr:phosphatase PAP2 family protein [Bacteroidales bacterium]